MNAAPRPPPSASRTSLLPLLCAPTVSSRCAASPSSLLACAPVRSRRLFARHPPTPQRQKRGGARGETYCITDAPSARSAPPQQQQQAGALCARACVTVQPTQRPGHSPAERRGQPGALIKLPPSRDYLYGGVGGGDGGGGAGLPGRSAAPLAFTGNESSTPPLLHDRQDPEHGTRIQNFGAAGQLKIVHTGPAIKHKRAHST